MPRSALLAAASLLIALGGCGNGGTPAPPPTPAPTTSPDPDPDPVDPTPPPTTAPKPPDSIAAPGAADQAGSAFTAYKEALVAGNHAAAAKLVGSGTTAYYERAARRALDAPESEVRALGLVDRLTVLTLRVWMPREDLETLDGRHIVRRGLELNLIPDVRGMDLGLIAAAGGQAAAEMYAGPRKLPFKMNFIREEGGWRLELDEVRDAAEPALRQYIAGSGRPEDDALLDILRNGGAEVDASVWQPLRGG